MDKETLRKTLESHRLWLNNEGGERANLRAADLRAANFRGVDLREANFRGVDLREADLRRVDLREADLRRADLRAADLREADLRAADLREADLSRADLDFSVLPLWCGGLRWKIDRRIAAQLAYHLCSMECDDPDFIRVRDSALDFANRFHRVEECGRLLPAAGEKKSHEK
jgi:uncharacterized protein YjbI with pentapeptide repeats